MDRKQHEQRIAQSLDLNNLLGEEYSKRVQAGRDRVARHEAEADARHKQAVDEAYGRTKKSEKSDD